MLQNYFKIALRMLWKRKVFTAVNIVGLAFGIAAFLLMLQYVSFAFGVNQFHGNLPNLYRAVFVNPNWIGETVPPTIGPSVKDNFPEVQAYVRVPTFGGDAVVSYAGTDTSRKQTIQSFREQKYLYADAGFFTLFSFPVTDGSGALKEPNTVVITESQARKYFGKTSAIGKVLTLNNQFGAIPYTVTGVCRDVPAQSDVQFDMVFSLQTFANPANLNGNGWATLDNWGTPAYQTYLLLQPGTDVAALEAKFHDLKMKLFPDGEEDVKLQAFRHIHLGESLTDSYPTSGSLLTVTFLLAVAIIILLIAWINYVNLSTAFALNRAKEVGIRKVVGALRTQLIGQYLLESLLLNVASISLALLLVLLLQEPFNAFTEKPLSLTLLNQGWFWLGGLLVLVAGTLLSGGYVALVLSSFNPIQALKGTLRKSVQGAFLRKGLVVFQFTVSIAFTVCTFALYQQLQYMRTQDLGMNIEQLLIINGPATRETNIRQRAIAFGNQVQQLPFVQAYSSSAAVPGTQNFGTNGITRLAPQPGDEKKNYTMLIVDERFLPTYQIQLAAGRNFTPVMSEQSWNKLRTVLLNESAVRQLGFASVEETVGQKITWGEPYEVVGVVKDYHHNSLRQTIEPTIFLADQNPVYFTIRLDASQLSGRIATLQRLYQAQFPGNPFEYRFADESYDQQYRTEQQFGQIFTASSGLAILIACLGLFGLAAFSAEQRTKEIGIRKVLGASVPNIITLLSKDFLKLILLAFVIAVPVAWYAVQRGLENFPYKIAFPWWIFALTGLLMLLIALLTVSFQAIKAALTNPVESLRSE